ncbi:hypothetical protein C8Q79DRAFT_931175 [Trametes meyenii]|nr:hypothetical protein C8Q79DRAFT_931175 [Trametes meyenii]
MPSRLPQEILDFILDYHQIQISCMFTKSYNNITSSYDALRGCCLTSPSWLPRSRQNLYSTVLLQSYQQVNSFLDTVRSQPFLASLVRSLGFSDKGPRNPDREKHSFVPFGRSELARRLPNIHTLMLDLDWRQYPPKYCMLSALYPVTELYLGVQSELKELAHLIRVMWAFSDLQIIRLYERYGWDSVPWKTWSDADTVNLEQAAQRRACCRSLRTLEIAGPNLVSSLTFPPTLVFGTSVEHLILHWQPYLSGFHEIGQTRALHHISHFHSLRELKIVMVPFSYEFESTGAQATIFAQIVPFLSAVKNHKNLRRVTLRFELPLTSWQNEPISRRVFLRKLFVPAVQESVKSLPPSLTELAFEVPYAPDDPTEVMGPHWWMREIRARLPDLKVEVSALMFYVDEAMMQAKSTRVMELYTWAHNQVAIWPLWMPVDADTPEFERRWFKEIADEPRGVDLDVSLPPQPWQTSPPRVATQSCKKSRLITPAPL